jgi:hypothetical protein
MGTPLPPLYRPEQAQTLADLRDRLGADTFEELWEQGREAAAAGDTVSFETADGPTRD